MSDDYSSWSDAKPRPLTLAMLKEALAACKNAEDDAWKMNGERYIAQGVCRGFYALRGEMTLQDEYNLAFVSALWTGGC